jgi:hypothetical protein
LLSGKLFEKVFQKPLSKTFDILEKTGVFMRCLNVQRPSPWGPAHLVWRGGLRRAGTFLKKGSCTSKNFVRIFGDVTF